jgi:hypothetical protein
MCLTPQEQILVLAVRVAQAQNALEEFVRGRGLNDPGQQMELRAVRERLERRDDQRAIAAFERALTMDAEAACWSSPEPGVMEFRRPAPVVTKDERGRISLDRPLPAIMSETDWL